MGLLVTLLMMLPLLASGEGSCIFPPQDQPQSVQSETVKFVSLTPNLLVEDVNASVEFYRDVLGFNLMMSVPETGRLDWAQVGNGGANIMLQSLSSAAAEQPVFADMKIGGSLGLFIVVKGVNELYERVKGKAQLVADIHDTFYGMREFAIQDNSGYILVFAEELSK
jgi:lactoylglutathione lyase